MSSNNERLSQTAPYREEALDADLGLGIRETRLGPIEDGIYNLPVSVQKVLDKFFPNSSSMRRVMAATNYRINNQIPRYYVAPQEGPPS